MTLTNVQATEDASSTPDDKQLNVYDDVPVNHPENAIRSERVAKRGQYHLSSWPRTGALLRALAATKPAGRILELGGGIGVGAWWMLDGMDSRSTLTTIEVHPRIGELCRRLLEDDDRATVINADVDEWLASYDGDKFDMAFLDTTSSKFERRDLVYPVLADGAIIVADDLLPNHTWDDRHPERVERFRVEVMEDPRLVPVLMNWDSGVLVAAYRPV